MEPVIHQSVTLPIPPATAFRWFVEKEPLEDFFAVEAEVEARVGGKYELSWDPANKPDNSTVGCCITAMAEPHLLAFDWRGPVEFNETMNAANPLTHVVVSIYPQAGGGSLVHLVHSGWRPGEDWLAARNYFDRGWRSVLDSLTERADKAVAQPAHA